MRSQRIRVESNPMIDVFKRRGKFGQRHTEGRSCSYIHTYIQRLVRTEAEIRVIVCL